MAIFAVQILWMNPWLTGFKVKEVFGFSFPQGFHKTHYPLLSLLNNFFPWSIPSTKIRLALSSMSLFYIWNRDLIILSFLYIFMSVSHFISKFYCKKKWIFRTIFVKHFKITRSIGQFLEKRDLKIIPLIIYIPNYSRWVCVNNFFF